MSRQGKLLVISGFAGTGKGTVVKKLLELYDNYQLSVSATTRIPRAGEVDGREYFFKTVEQFKEMIANNELLEYAEYVNNYYGTPKEYVSSQLEKGNNVILEIESVGALNIKKIFPDAVLIFIMPPSAAELERRLRGRNTEDEATILKRLGKASSEAGSVEKYDYVVVNDLVEECAELINGIAVNDVQICKAQGAAENIQLINNIKEELKIYSEGEI